MSAPATILSPPTEPEPAPLRVALDRVAAGADELDRAPEFPHAAFAALADAGVLGATLPGSDGGRMSFADELALVWQVARADGSVGRILDGHFNAVERLCVARPGTLDEDERAALSGGAMLLGVWGADPGPGEGEPARLVRDRGATSLEGVKTFLLGGGRYPARPRRRPRSGGRASAGLRRSVGRSVGRPLVVPGGGIACVREPSGRVPSHTRPCPARRPRRDPARAVVLA